MKIILGLESKTAQTDEKHWNGGEGVKRVTICWCVLVWAAESEAAENSTPTHKSLIQQRSFHYGPVNLLISLVYQVEITNLYWFQILQWENKNI